MQTKKLDFTQCATGGVISKFGWVKLHRSVLDSEIIDNPILLSLWVYLLANTNFKESKELLGRSQKLLMPGQSIIRMRELSKKWSCSLNTIWKWLHYLHTTNRIVIETRTRGTIVTICNWEEYQNEEKINEHRTNTERTPSEHTHYSKKGRRKEERVESTALPPLAQLWNKHSDPRLPKVLKINPSSKRHGALKARWAEEPNEDFWVNVIKRINSSSFLLGDNDRGWRANLDWLLQPDASSKVLEGKYDGRQVVKLMTDEEKAKIPGWQINNQEEIV